MIQANYQQYILHFKQPGGTSRGILKTKETWFLIVNNNGKTGVGECAVFRGLSADDCPDYEKKLAWVCKNIHLGLSVLLKELTAFPSIQFGLEQAFLSLESENQFVLFPSGFTKKQASISINGLVWMGNKQFMKQQIKEKIALGFTCIKMKIGAIDFETEYDLLKSVRQEFSEKDIELRVDANGAFCPSEALEKLKKLSALQVHSIEQPVKPNYWQEMADLCQKSPIPIALDESLIGVFPSQKKHQLLETIKPQYIILKPSLLGGFAKSKEWISLAAQHNIGWWITSALESNIGLNAIAQFTYTLQNNMPQGLGTGSLFTNNFDSPLTVKQGNLQYIATKKWNFNL